ncbi:hypothetical protein AMS68_005712 [Peltaster fructicola]|uniref:Uncharacterized protein n=1 Tax=Peltaster fructicola TaxID=286661 RepID=A0A6H0XZV1_9PEZI|nr:hypothetical protein AMS68_005712 [Peltaster fructicola]
MSLQEVYRLAHTAECRLNISAARPDRNLRFVVGHLMHYESLRLRIVEIEHVIGRNHRMQATHAAQAHRQLEDSSHQPRSTTEDEDLDVDLAEADDTNEHIEDLGLMRFPSGSTRPPPLVADTEDDEEEEDAAEPTSPTEPNAAILKQALKRPADTELAQEFERVRNCACHGRTDAPHVEKIWKISSGENRPGVTRAVAQVAD